MLRETEAPADDSPDSLTTFALAMARTGQLERAAGILEERCKLTPEYAETIETHAEILDMVGESERARAKYETARRLRAQVRPGMPDRSFALRGRGSFLIETVSYSHASNVMKDRLLPLIARGNAYLAERKPAAALADYEQVLKFKPGTLQGSATTFKQLPAHTSAYNTDWGGFAPSLGAAWTLAISRSRRRWR